MSNDRTVFTPEVLAMTVDVNAAFSAKVDDGADVLWQLASDISRNTLKIGGEIDGTLKKAADSYVNDKNKTNTEFKDTLKAILKTKNFNDEQIDSLFKHYSQRPMYATKALVTIAQNQNEEISIGVGDAKGIECNLFVGDNGKVSLVSECSNLCIKDPFGKAATIPVSGVASSSFELTESGFEFRNLSATDEVAARANRHLFDKNKVDGLVGAIKQALIENNAQLFIVQLYAFQKYLDDTLLRFNPTMNIDAIKEKIGKDNLDLLADDKRLLVGMSAKLNQSFDMDSSVFEDLNSLNRLNLAVSVCLPSPPDKAIDKGIHKVKDELLLERLTTTVPIVEIPKKVNELFSPDSTAKSDFNGKLLEYKLAHTRTIVQAQTKLEGGGLLENGNARKPEGPNLSQKVAYDILSSMRRLILDTSWKVTRGGKLIGGKKYPTSIFEMLKKMNDPLNDWGKNQSLDMVSLLAEVRKIGLDAETKISFSRLGRDKATQDFYQSLREPADAPSSTKMKK